MKYPDKIYKSECKINPVLSRVCNRGTKSCEVEHVEYIRSDMATKNIRMVYEKMKRTYSDPDKVVRLGSYEAELWEAIKADLECL